MKQSPFDTQKFNTYRTEFYVTGRGAFPFDMLRYDQAYPATSEDAAKLDVDLTNVDDRRRWRSIKMVSLNTIGPTVDRWSSFGWTASAHPLPMSQVG